MQRALLAEITKVLHAAETIITAEDIAMAKLERASEEYGPHIGFYMFKSRDVHILIKLTATVSKKTCSTVPTGHGVSKMLHCAQV